jgi:ribose transport system substrate-binding protein
MPATRSIVWLGVVVLAAVTGYVLAGRHVDSVRPAPPPRLALVTGGSSPFWQMVISGGRAAAADHGAELVVMAPDTGLDGQLKEVSAIDAQDFDGMAISPLNPEAMTAQLSRVADGMALVTYDSDAPNSNRLCYVGTNNVSAGAICFELVKEALPAGGRIVALFANLDKDNALLRKQGFEEALAAARRDAERNPEAPRYEVLETMFDNIDPQKCTANIKQALAAHPDLDCFVGMFGYHGPLLLNARVAGDIPSRVKLVVFDEDERVLDGIQDGAIYGTVIQDPYKYGYESVRMLTALHAGRSNELPIANRGSLFIPCESVTADNLVQFRQRLEKRQRH